MIKYVKPLQVICLRDEDRPNFSLIHIKDGCATATNGRIIIRMDLTKTSRFEAPQIAQLNGKYIHMDIWALMNKCDEVFVDDEQICIKIKGVPHLFEYSYPQDHNRDEMHEWETSQAKWFDLDKILQRIKFKGETEQRICAYSAKDVKLVSKAFGQDHLYFSFTADEMGTVVFPGEDMGMYAIVIPIDAGGVNRSMFV